MKGWTEDERELNINERRLREFAAYNELKITKIIFSGRGMLIYTWSVRGYRYVIDYVILNTKLARE